MSRFLLYNNYVTYCQARGLSGHTSPHGECVFFNLEDSMPPEVGEDHLPFSWLDSKWAHLVYYEEIFDFELELITSFWQAYLGKPMLSQKVKLVGYGPQLLTDSLGWSDYESDCSALFTPARTSSR